MALWGTIYLGWMFFLTSEECNKVMIEDKHKEESIKGWVEKEKETYDGKMNKGGSAGNSKLYATVKM